MIKIFKHNINIKYNNQILHGMHDERDVRNKSPKKISAHRDVAEGYVIDYRLKSIQNKININIRLKSSTI